MAIVHTIATIRKVNVNMAHRNKTLHLVIEINQALIEGLVDIRASMLIMVTTVGRELGIMHLVVGHQTYKVTSRLVTYALRRITELLAKVGGILCPMSFLVVDINNYDLLLGLIFL